MHHRYEITVILITAVILDGNGWYCCRFTCNCRPRVLAGFELFRHCVGDIFLAELSPSAWCKNQYGCTLRVFSMPTGPTCKACVSTRPFVPHLTMKAIVYRKAGPPSVLEVANNWPQPERAYSQVKVRVFATSVNPIDFKARAGKAFPYLLKVPHVSSSCKSVQCVASRSYLGLAVLSRCALPNLQQACNSCHFAVPVLLSWLCCTGSRLRSGRCGGRM